MHSNIRRNVYDKQWMNSKEYAKGRAKRIEYSKIKEKPYDDVLKYYISESTPGKANIDYETS